MYHKSLKLTSIITDVATRVNVSLQGGKVHPVTKTVFQFHGCHCHGCIHCFPNPEQRNEVIRIDKKGNEITRDDAYQRTLKRSEVIRSSGYRLVKRWKRQEPRPWWDDKLPLKRNETYPHAIVFDFEAYQDKTKASNPKCDLSFESEHVPISVSTADTLNPEPGYICSKDPNELISLFYQCLVLRSLLDPRRCGRKIHARRSRVSSWKTTRTHQAMVFTSASGLIQLR